MRNASYGQEAGALEPFLELENTRPAEFELEDAELEQEWRRARPSQRGVPTMRGRAAPGRPPAGRSGPGVQRAGRPAPGAGRRRPAPQLPVGRPPRRQGKRPGFRPRPVVRLPLVPFAPVPSDRIQWIQDCLNTVMGARLRITGIMNVATRSLLRSFQRRSGLPITGFPDAATVQALGEACAAPAMPPQSAVEPAPLEEPAVDAAADDGGAEEPPPAEEEFGLEQETMTDRVLRTLPPNLEVTWESAGTLHTAAIGAPSTGGVYVIFLPPGSHKQAYVGKAVNLNRRLKEHLWCATHLGLAVGGYRVKLARVADPNKRSRIELHINSELIAKGKVTNRKRQELEQELELELWGGSRG